MLRRLSANGRPYPKAYDGNMGVKDLLLALWTKELDVTRKMLPQNVILKSSLKAQRLRDGLQLYA